jgi:hypothetical protein
MGSPGQGGRSAPLAPLGQQPVHYRDVLVPDEDGAELLHLRLRFNPNASWTWRCCYSRQSSIEIPYV